MATCGKNPFARMNKRVTFQAALRAPDGQGGFADAWADIATVWATLEPVKGWEKFQAGQTQTPVTHQITCRYRPDYTTAARLVYGTRVFDVKEALNDGEQNVLLKIKAVESGEAHATLANTWESLSAPWGDHTGPWGVPLADTPTPWELNDTPWEQQT